MTDEIEYQLLELDDPASDAVARCPPLIRIERRVAGRANRDFRLAALHGTMEHPAETSRVIR